MDIKAKNFKLRKVREDDCRLLWKWASDSGVRGGSFSSDPIGWEEHVHWFARKLNDPNCYILLGVNEQGTPVGEVRFDRRNETEAEIGVSVDRNKRGFGYGSLLIHMAVERVFKSTSIRIIHAFIKTNNEKSIKVFERAGFKTLNVEMVKGNSALHYQLVKSDEN